MKQYQTYKFYETSGKRLAIFYDDGYITIIPCSKNDQFSRKIAREINIDVRNNVNDYFADIISIEFNSQNEFINWCMDKYYKKIIMVIQTPKHEFIIDDIFIMDNKNNTDIEIEALIKQKWENKDSIESLN